MSRAVIIDFDWPGVDGVSRYPATLNCTNNCAEEVLPYGIMHKAHDLWQLERLRIFFFFSKWCLAGWFTFQPHAKLVEFLLSCSVVQLYQNTRKLDRWEPFARLRGPTGNAPIIIRYIQLLANPRTHQLQPWLQLFNNVSYLKNMYLELSSGIPYTIYLQIFRRGLESPNTDLTDGEDHRLTGCISLMHFRCYSFERLR